MLRFAPFAALLLSTSWIAVAQTKPPHPSFEVASLKPSAPIDGPPMMAEVRGRAIDGMYDGHPPGWLPIEKTRINIRGRSLAGLIATAYRVRTIQVSGPSWIKDARFDIEATIPLGTAIETVDEMLQSLLEERFGLQLHREEKEASGLALLVAKGGIKFEKAAENKPEPPPLDEDAKKEQMKKQQDDVMKRMQERMKAMEKGERPPSTNSWKARAITMDQLAAWLSQNVQKPVSDMTELEGKYDLDIEVARYADDTPEYAASQAVAKLGLKLEARKITSLTLVVDKAERNPIPN